jgi:hypothetical protein
MFDDRTWDAILRACPWFGAAAVVFVVAVGLFLALKPKPKRQPETVSATHNMNWTLTRRIDLADPQLAGAFVLEVEESRISTSPTGVEHREIRWRRATLPEAKMVLESYPAHENLPMSEFTATVPAGTKPNEAEIIESIATVLKDAGNGHDMAHVTLVPRDIRH